MAQAPKPFGGASGRSRKPGAAPEAGGHATAAGGACSEMTVQNRLSENVRRLRFMQMSKGGKQQQQQTGLRAFQQQQLLMLQQEQQRQQALQQEQQRVKRAQQLSATGDKQGHAAETHGEEQQQQDATVAAAETGHPPSAVQRQKAVSSRSQHDRQQQELLRQRQQELLLAGWCAPGWEIAENLYELQQQREEQVLSQAYGQQIVLDKGACGKYVLYRRSYGGFNPSVEAQMRRVEKKVQAAERRREEEEEAQRWQQARAGRQHIVFS